VDEQQSQASVETARPLVSRTMGCCSRGDAGVVLPVAEAPTPATADATSASDAVETTAAEERSATSKVLGMALKDDLPAGERISITLRQGDGSTIAVSVHPDQTITQVHTQISRALGAHSYPAYALRLIFKARVLSMHGENTIRSFDIHEGDIIQMVVVRDGAAHRFTPAEEEIDKGGDAAATQNRSMRRLSTQGLTFHRRGTTSRPPPPASP